MRYQEKNGRLVVTSGNQTIWIDPWGENSLRVRITQEAQMDQNDWALTEEVTKTTPVIKIEDVKITEPWFENSSDDHSQTFTVASITNGKVTARFNHEGWLSFENERGEVVLQEYWRNRNRIDRYCVPIRIDARELKAIPGTTDYELTMRFESNDNEKIFGMGQYQEAHLDKKGSVLELAHRNSQASVPFYLSSLGYGFLWNNPAIGNAIFGNNKTEWTAKSTKKADYFITVSDKPEEILRAYTEATGRAPMMPEYGMGFWQCKLRYRTQEELVNVVREHKKRGLPMDVIVSDFFHWTKQGEFKFDPVDWPDPEAMVKELKDLGVELMVSVWPTIDSSSENFGEMAQRGLLVRSDRGCNIHMNWMGETIFFDATNPDAQEFVWDRCKENYFDKGIKIFWLDEAEPEYGPYDFDVYRYFAGPALQTSNLYPKMYAKGFYDGMKKEGMDKILNLVRCAWAGSQKYGALVWSGDVHSSFRALREQLQAGLSMGLAGIPWWTTDIGGFLGGDINDEGFRELIVRWFEWGTFCPVMRLHGERPPFKPLDEEFRNGTKLFSSGQDNEVWSFGDKVYDILTKYLFARENMRPYIRSLMEKAHTDGSPVMRTMFYEFPEDKKCWDLYDQYMFGSDILVAPVTEAGVREREVYLPKGKWINVYTNEVLEGGKTISTPAPLEIIPLFVRENAQVKIF